MADAVATGEKTGRDVYVVRISLAGEELRRGTAFRAKAGDARRGDDPHRRAQLRAISGETGNPHDAPPLPCSRTSSRGRPGGQCCAGRRQAAPAQHRHPLRNFIVSCCIHL